MGLFQALPFFQHFQEGHQGFVPLMANYHQELSSQTWVQILNHIAHPAYRHPHGPPIGLSDSLVYVPFVAWEESTHLSFPHLCLF